MKSRVVTLTVTAIVLLCVLFMIGFAHNGSTVKETYSNKDAETHHLSSDLAKSLRQSIDNLERKISDLTGMGGSNAEQVNHQAVSDHMKVTELPPTKKYPSVCCFVITDPAVLSKTVYVRDTWTRRCDKSFFMSSQRNDSFPTIGLGNETMGRGHLAAKARKSWLYLYDNHLNDCEFFLKGDPDTYIVVENLKEYLSNFNHEESLYFGHRYRPKGWSYTYMAGGPGVILSRTAVKDMVEKTLRSDNATRSHCMWDGGTEDLRIAACLSMVGSRVVDTRDELGRQRFIVFGLSSVFRGGYPKWYNGRDLDGKTRGLQCCSDYPIGFHYVGKEEIYKLEYFWYRTKKKFDLGIQQIVPEKPEVETGVGY